MNKKLALLVTLMVGGLTSAFAGPYDTWSNYKTISANLTGITDSAESNFPLLVRLTNASTSTGSDVLAGSLTSGGLDVVFTDSTGQVALNFERERFTATNGEFWVKLPTLLSNATTKIRIYWGKSGATDQSNSPGVWDTTSTGNAYRAVWHMNGTGPTETDVTANAWVLQAAGSATPNANQIPTAQVASPIVYGRQLNSSNNVLSPTGFSAPNGMYFLNSVQGNTAGTGWAVGNGGAILKTINGGNAWTAQTSHTTQNLRAVYFTDANHGIAVGDNGTIDTTASGGANWGLVTNPFSSAGVNLHAVAFIGGTNPSLNSGYIVGDSGEMAQITNFSTPGSAVYTYISAATSGISAIHNLRGIACDSNVCLTVGDSATVSKIYGLQSTPAYVNENALASNLYNLKAVTYTGRAFTFVAVGDSNATTGIIYKGVLTNNGTANTLTKFAMKAPAFPTSGTVPNGVPPLTAVAAGVPDSTLLSGGSAASGNYGANYIGVWAVGQGGTIVRSLNTGTSWGPSPSGTTNNLTCVSVPLGTTTRYTSDFGWAGGASGTLLTTGNFGQWFQVTTGTSVAQAGSLNITNNELNFINSSAFTISTWVKQVSYNNDYQSVASKGDQFYTLQNNTGAGEWTAGLYYGGTYDNWFTQALGPTGVEAQLGSWHYIVFTRNPNTLTTTAGNQIWVDGVLADTGAVVPGTSTTETVNAALSIGRTLDGGNTGDSARFYPGTLSQYTLASMGRDSSWIKAEYNTQSASQTAVAEGSTVSNAIAPVVTTSPAAQTSTVGSSVNFTVVVTGTTPLVYKWIQTQGVTADTLKRDTLSALTDTLKLTSIPMGDTGTYSVVISNAAGSVTSASARLTLTAGPGITSSPASASIILGGSVKFGVTISGSSSTPLTYKWMHLHGGVTDTLKKDTTSLFTDTLALSSIPMADTGSYEVFVSNSAGSATSLPGLLNVYTVPSAPTITSVKGASGQITVYWTTPASNGAAITGYKVTSVQDTSKHCTSTAADSCIVTGLTNTTSYSFTVVATNLAGNSAPSGASTATTNVFSFNSKAGFGLQMAGSTMLLHMPQVSGEVRVSILDMWGRTVWNRSVSGEIGQLTWNGNSNQGSAAPVGMYVLRLTFQKGEGNPASAIQTTFVKQ